MDEKQIRELEIEAAKAMGWEDIQIESRLDEHYTYIDDWYGVKPPNTGVYAIPRYARDPAAILRAIEWLIAKWGMFSIDRFNGKEYLSPGGGGETIGIAVCDVIAGYRRNTDQSPPSQDTGREE